MFIPKMLPDYNWPSLSLRNMIQTQLLQEQARKLPGAEAWLSWHFLWLRLLRAGRRTTLGATIHILV